MKSILIITEDLVKIQTYSGLLGRTFVKLYTSWLKIRLQTLLVILKPFVKITVLASDGLIKAPSGIIFYGEELAKIDYAKNKDWYLSLTTKLLDFFNQPELTPIFKTRLAIFLTYHYLVYVDLYQLIIKQVKPDKVILLGKSFHEQLASRVSRENSIKANNLSWLSFSYLSNYLKLFLLNREYQKKLHQFISGTKLPKQRNLKNNPTLLSLDFYRHLKTLAPLYKRLETANKNPLIVTDIINLQAYFANFGLQKANWVHIGQFSNIPNTSKTPSINNIDDFLMSLCFKTAKPIIANSFYLSKLYLQAGRNLYKQLKPKGLVVVSDLRFLELSLAKLSNKLKVPSVLVSPNTLLSFDELNPYDNTDQVAVVGEFIKQKLINQGLDPNKINVVGDFRAESALAYQGLNLNLKDKQKIILLISFRSTWMIPKPEKKAFFVMAAKAVEKLPNTILVVKPHPTEKRNWVLEELKEWGIKNAIVVDNQKQELSALLQASSVVLQTWSMTIFEAISANKPVISINPFNKNYQSFLPVLKYGGAIEVSKQNQLDRWLKVLINPQDKNTIKQLQTAEKANRYFIAKTAKAPSSQVVDLLFPKH
ncbi:UDP-N-acetylglucosamine 2-epimerase [Patescibacteria group bacterium]|nr:UDP-N-acetylglucosamine 2-epimerase [Patescibacteria group bacterium]MBU1499989.1 UDP-N-acetylglucosamine 2-epimerase [Patescibacteria group bacterium]